MSTKWTLGYAPRVDETGAGRRRSGRQRLTRDRIVDAALRTIDEIGASRLTMRALAARLDADPTAVYRHFPDKDALLGALADAVLDEVVRPLAPHATPRDGIRAAAHRLRDVLRARPGLVAVIAGAPVTPATVTATDSALRLLGGGDGGSDDGGGPGGPAQLRFATLLAYVLGTGLIEANPPPPVDGPAGPAQRFWTPDAAELDERFAAGLELLLDALEGDDPLGRAADGRGQPGLRATTP